MNLLKHHNILGCWVIQDIRPQLILNLNFAKCRGSIKFVAVVPSFRHFAQSMGKRDFVRFEFWWRCVSGGYPTLQGPWNHTAVNKHTIKSESSFLSTSEKSVPDMHPYVGIYQFLPKRIWSKCRICPCLLPTAFYFIFQVQDCVPNTQIVWSFLAL